MRFLSSVLLSVWISACGTTGIEIEYDGPTLDIEIVAIGHVELHLERAKAWHRYEKLRDALAVIEEIEGLDTVAPFEYERASQIMDPRDYLRFTTLGPRLQTLGVPPERMVVLEVVIDEAVMHQHTAMDTRKQIIEARRMASEIVVRAELIYPAKNLRLGKILVYGSESRFDDVPAYDGRPTAKRLLLLAVTRLIAALESEDVIRAAGPTSPVPAVVENPAPVRSYGDAGETLDDLLATRDEFSREAELYTRFRYFDHDMPVDRFRTMAAAPAGVWLGDTLVTRMDGEPVHHSFQWSRRWRRKKPATLAGPGGPIAIPVIDQGSE